MGATGLKIRGTNVLLRNINATSRFVVNQGGTRSSKTYSIAQLFITKLFSVQGKCLSICRKTLPSLRSSVMRDWFEIMNSMGIYDERFHNKSEHTYILNNNLVEFFSLDQPQKRRGAKRDYLWMNEANEFTEEDFLQLNLRTTEQVFLDYNPSDEFHWIYDKVIPKPDCTFISSTYKDNPFIPAEIVKQIEALQETNPLNWKVYGLGERGYKEQTIYPHFQIKDKFPDFDDYCYGLDFGYNNPTALVKVAFKDNIAYWEEILYETKLTTTDLIEKMKQLIPNRRKEIFADSAEPKTIEEISRAGFNIKPADKDVNKRIDKVRSMKLAVSTNSVSLIKELKSYAWKVNRDGKTLDEPVKMNDHAVDAGGYAQYNFLTRHRMTKYPTIHYRFTTR